MAVNLQEIIRARYSVRSYLEEPISDETQATLMASLEALQRGPLGSRIRLGLIAATQEDRASLRGLGTYGFIRNPAGFILGAVEAGEHALEDFGYMMEKAVLEATALGLGTCWLGGTFTKSSFAEKIGRGAGEVIPAVTALGYAKPDARSKDLLRRGARAETRLPWDMMFFEGSLQKPITSSEQADGYAAALEMVRLAPSASNKQPWRILKEGSRWHFYCQRTPGYGKGSWYFSLLGLADLQRLDVGIAMCHFARTAEELGLPGRWMAVNPGLETFNENMLYIATWEGAPSDVSYDNMP